MEYLLYSIVPILGGFIWYAIIHDSVRVPGRRLNKKFVSLGNLAGKSFIEISNVVGQPNSVSQTIGSDGEVIIIRQWIETSYHIVLLFDSRDICLGIQSETSV